MIVGELPLTTLFHAHVHGQATILRMRGRRLVHSPWSRSLVGQINRGLIWRDLSAGLKPTFNVTGWPSDLYASPLACGTARWSHRASVVCAQVIEVLKEAHGRANAKKTSKIVISGNNSEASPDHESHETLHVNLAAAIMATVALDSELERFLTEVSEPYKPFSLPVRFETPPPVCTDAWQLLGNRAGDPSATNTPSTPLEEAFPQPIGPRRPLIVKSSDHAHNVAGNHDGDNSSSTSYHAMYPRRIDVYPSPTIAALILPMFNVRIYLLRSMIDLALLHADMTQQARPEQQLPTFVDQCFATFPSPAQLHARLSTMIEDICAGIPYILGDVDEAGNMGRKNNGKLGFTSVTAVVWSLSHIYRMSNIDPGLRQWILSIFDRVGTSGGIRKGLVLSQVYRQKAPPTR